MYKLAFIAKTLIAFTLSIKTFASSPQVNVDYRFSTGNKEWVGAFSDYPPNQESFYELSWGWENLPLEIQSQTKGLYLSGNNHSDDLFMYVKHQMKGLRPNKKYKITFFLTIENNIPPGLSGIGGSPGESVFVKVGASTNEPQNIDINGLYVLNIDKGEQSQGGKNAIVVGDLANESVDPKAPEYKPKTYDNRNTPLIVKSDRYGNIWLFVGSDSGFEATTKYYIAEINVRAEPEL